MLLPAGDAGRGIPARRAGASAVIAFLAPLAGAPAARTLRGGVAAGGETRRQDPKSVNVCDFLFSPCVETHGNTSTPCAKTAAPLSRPQRPRTQVTNPSEIRTRLRREREPSLASSVARRSGPICVTGRRGPTPVDILVERQGTVKSNEDEVG